MGVDEILLTGKDSRTPFQGRRSFQLESRELGHDEKVLKIVRMMSHDIRDSLVSMAATLKLLSRGYYGRVDGSAGHRLDELLSKIIGLIGVTEEYLSTALSVNDILGVETGVSDLTREIVIPVLEELSSEMRDRRIFLENRLPAHPPGTILVKGNKIWLKAVFRNLLRNAVKYGDEGGTVALGFEDRGTYCRISIFNSGKPVPEEYRERLFTGVTQGNSGDGGGSSGLGLGLCLVKEIIQKQGGEIWYEPRENGSNFIFTLPTDSSRLDIRSVVFGVPAATSLQTVQKEKGAGENGNVKKERECASGGEP